MEKLIMTFKVHTAQEDISSVEGVSGSVFMIPFYAEVESPLFTGKTRPGACDVQTENPAKVRYMCAKYLFEGTDSEGEKCHLYVQNEGWITPDNCNAPYLEAVPHFITDSLALEKYLCRECFRSEVVPTGPDSIDIRIYDMDSDLSN